MTPNFSNTNTHLKYKKDKDRKRTKGRVVPKITGDDETYVQSPILNADIDPGPAQ